MSEDFKSITITFNKGNQDVKEIIKDLVDKTGQTKVDIICQALRQYQHQLNNTTTNNNNNINKDEVKGMVKESLLEILLQNQFNGGIQVIQQPQMKMEVVKEKSKEEIEKERLNSLNNKNIDNALLDDED